MNSRVRLLAGVILLLPLRGGAAPQLPDSISPPPPPVAAARTDTLPPGYQPTKSTALAMGLSAILPGAGQVYNESYWKVPVILGFGGYFMYEILRNHSQYKEYRDRYAESLETVEGGNPQDLALREFYRDERDRFGWYFLILYALNVLDAYVDASLYDFDVGEDLSIGIHPQAGGGPSSRAALTFTIRF